MVRREELYWRGRERSIAEKLCSGVSLRSLTAYPLGARLKPSFCWKSSDALMLLDCCWRQGASRQLLGAWRDDSLPFHHYRQVHSSSARAPEVNKQHKGRVPRHHQLAHGFSTLPSQEHHFAVFVLSDMHQRLGTYPLVMAKW